MSNFMRLVIAVVCFLLPALPLLGEVGEKGDKSGKEHVVLLNDANTVQAEFRVGAGGKIGIGFKFADGKTQTLLGVVKADVMKRTVEKDGKKALVDTPMPDAFVEFRGAGLTFQNHVRPNLVRYTEAQREDLVKTWDALPSATQHWTALEVRAPDAGAELWMEGRFCGHLVNESKLVEVSFQLAEGGAVRGQLIRSN